MKTLHAALWMLLFWLPLSAKSEIPVPSLSGRVIDQTGTLTGTQKSDLTEMLHEFEQRKGSQIAVLIIPTTGSEAIEQYALRVVEQWKLGRKSVDDGVLLLVAKDDRTMRIEVGYGLEGALTDVTAKRIIAEIITPYFKSGDFYSGIYAGLGQMIRVVDGEPLPTPKTKNFGSNDWQQNILILFVLALIVAGAARLILGNFFGAIATGGILGLIAWFIAGTIFIAFIVALVAFLFALINPGSSGNSYYDDDDYPRRGGGFGGGGFGGGGFGGGGGFSGGGGGFGGGGASGKW